MYLSLKGFQRKRDRLQLFLMATGSRKVKVKEKNSFMFVKDFFPYFESEKDPNMKVKMKKNTLFHVYNNNISQISKVKVK